MSTGVTILGSTGAIGGNTLEVLARHRAQYHVSALVADRNVAAMLTQCQQYRPKIVVMAHTESAAQLRQHLADASLPCEVMAGARAVCEVAAGVGDTVVCGIAGAAGLASTIAAVEAGKKVLVANKEPLVMLGQYIMQRAVACGACLLPLDSEHNAIFQCLPQPPLLGARGRADLADQPEIEKIILTASGGPVRTLTQSQLAAVTPEQACAHPNWRMGRKISVDSATMMNKGLELIEACNLFNIPPARLSVVIHPQSIIHSMVAYIDGSVLAQMANPDMRVCIANALAWPRRIESGAPPLDFTQLPPLNFAAADPIRFPALQLATEAATRGGTLPAIMNAANEIAVEAFLQRRLSFDKITDPITATMTHIAATDTVDLETVLAADRAARAHATAQIAN